MIYSLIAKETFVLGEYTTFDGDFSERCRKLMIQSRKDSAIKTYTKDDYSYHLFSNDEGFTFLCMTMSDTNHKIAINFLKKLEYKLMEHIGNSKRQRDLSFFITKTLKSLMVIHIIFLNVVSLL
jgi:hypothetical protein